ncbi:hypothetical protein RB598_008282 [Gaeumannomyces tritici]
MPAGDNNPLSSLLVRWKQHVDHHVNTTLNDLFGIPSVVSKSYAAGDNGVAASAPSGGSTPAASAPGPARDSDAGEPTQYHFLEGLLMRQWYHWAVLSPYSPFNLQHLPPPIPNDLSADAASPNGFADAFEDLLRASSGQSLADHQERQRRATDPERRRFDRRVLWLADLRHGNLLASYYPAGSDDSKILGPLMAGSSPTAWLASLRRRGLYDSVFPSDSDIRLSPSRHMRIGSLAVLPPRDPWNFYWQDVADWGFRGWGNAGLRLGFDSGWLGLPEPGEPAQPASRWPETEEALFDGTRRRPQEQPDAREPGTHTTTETIAGPNGTTTIITRNEEVDKDGNVRHTRIVSKTVDADGNEIARQTESRYQASFGGKWSWDSSKTEDGGKQDGDGTKKDSWFWKSDR